MSSRLLLVDSKVLPDVYDKVVEVNKLIASGSVKTVSEALTICGISRSAYYKYKDYVSEYTRSSDKIVSLHAVLCDKAGVLSGLLMEIYGCGGNILTVNQGLPSSGTASVSVSLRVSEKSTEIDGMIASLSKLDGVISVKQIPGQ